MEKCVALRHNRRKEKSRKKLITGKYVLSYDGVTIDGGLDW
jgi:hypothetical protein